MISLEALAFNGRLYQRISLRIRHTAWGRNRTYIYGRETPAPSRNRTGRASLTKRAMPTPMLCGDWLRQSGAQRLRAADTFFHDASVGLLVGKQKALRHC